MICYHERMPSQKKEKPGARKISKSWSVALALLAVFALRAGWHARDKSATYDEGGHLTCGLLLWKTDFSDYDITHPPLIRYWLAAPAAALGPSLPPLPLPRDVAMESLARASVNDLFAYAAHLIYRNTVPADRMIFASRCAAIALGLLCGLLVFRWSSRLYGPEGGLISLTLFAFCPNLAANASLITTDFPGAASAVAFLYALSRLLEREDFRRTVLAGIALGAALLCKLSNVTLFPLFLLLFAVLRARKEPKSALRTAAGVLAVSWLVVCAGYGFESVFVPHLLTAEDWGLVGWGPALQALYRFLPLPERLLRGIMEILAHNDRGHGAFLLGHYSLGGWWYYFPVAILVKTPTAALALFAAWIAVFLRAAVRSLRSEENGIARDEIVLLAGLALFFGGALSAKLNIGIRYVIIVYPILYILAGRLGVWMRTRAGRIALGIAALALAAEVLANAPDELAFFNRAAGGPSAGPRYLSDSNIDWGQDLKNLGEYLESQGKPEVLLSYFGTAVPQYYGIEYQKLPSGWSYPGSQHLNSPEPRKELLAISVTNLQGTYFANHDLYGWLRQRTPARKLGGSIYVYDVTDDLETHERLREIYRLAGMAPEAAREEDRVRRLSYSSGDSSR